MPTPEPATQLTATTAEPGSPEHIAALVDTWPPLTPHQRSVIAAAFQTPQPGEHQRSA